VRWLRLAADQGFASAQLYLGLMYDLGHGVPQDYQEAVPWYRLAAGQGHFYAQYNLGGMYGLGRGVPQDYVQAHLWYNLAASQGYQAAAKLRDSLAQKMMPAQVAEAQRLAREWRPRAPAAAGSAPSAAP
jgi:hypothetical protein